MLGMGNIKITGLSRADLTAAGVIRHEYTNADVRELANSTGWVHIKRGQDNEHFYAVPGCFAGVHRGSWEVIEAEYMANGWNVRVL